MISIFSEFFLKGINVKNRIVFPPVVCFGYAGGDGLATDRNLEHYSHIARGGPGIIIVEATAVKTDGRLAPCQLGLWSDDQIPGMTKIASAIKHSGAVALVQIHHAGLITNEKVSDIASGPSADVKNPRTRALTIPEIENICSSFINSAFRAQQAGFDGVELHGAHGYLLNQFASSFFNQRNDEYGGSLESNMKLGVNIIRGIRNKCGQDFIIGYRLGANSPSLEDGIAIAKYLEAAGIDLLHVSHGGSMLNLPRTPKGYEYNWIVYSGTVIKSHVRLPVIVVNEIRTRERAAWLVENDHADFIALGRPQLADPDWVNHTMENKEVIECLGCKPRCRWFEDGALCAARKKLKAG